MGKKTKKDFSEAVCHKNDELALEIIDMGTEGEGIIRYGDGIFSFYGSS